MTALRFGILGAAGIAPKGFVAPAADIGTIEITRVAARDRSRAQAFADAHDIAGVSDSYHDVINADDVDVIYNPLPMSLHAEWTIAALDAGKHVFCEKPLASNAAEAADMQRAAERNDRILGEAFHYWYHPLFQHVLYLVRRGTIGSIERVDANFAITIPKPSIRWTYETGGGSLMDLGCYPVHWVRSVVGAEPTVVSAHAELDGDEPKVDAAITAELAFPNGATGRVHSSMIASEKQIDLTITGSEGTIEVENPLAPQDGNSVTVTTASGSTTSTIDAGVTYAHMLRAFADHVVHGLPYPTSGDDSVQNMAAIDAIYQAAGLPLRGL